MHVIVNGTKRELTASSSLQHLLGILEMGAGRLAVEVNGEIVPRSTFEQCILQAGDKIEIVQAIGGG